MEKIYKLNKKRMIIYLLVFLLASSMVTLISIEGTIKYKKVLEKCDVTVNKGNLNTYSVNILEKMNYDNNAQRYSLRLFRTIIICVIELIILYLYFLKNSKILIDEEGIKVYTLYKRKPHKVYPWHEISHIKFHYGNGIRGLISEYGMKINNTMDEEVFVPIERLLNYNEISGVLIEKCPQIKIEVPQNIKKESYSVIKLFNNAYLEYKNDFGAYMIYSFIVLIFALLNVLFNNTPVSLITVVAYIYFGYRAKIAMNYKAYMSYKGKKIDFDMGWNYAKGKMDSYFGSNMIIGIIVTIFIGIGYFCLISDLEKSYKILLSVILGIGCLFSVGRIYLITYIASIVDTNQSYMSLNGMLIKKYYKEVVLVVALLSLQLIPGIIIGTIYYKDVYTIKILVTRVAYINVVLDLFISPYVSCFIMKFLAELPVSGGGNHNE